MRTFPKELAAFRLLVCKRGDELRKLSLADLTRLREAPLEHVIVETRPATIGIIVHPVDDHRSRIVVRGFMKSRWLPGSSVALDGFYKDADGTVTPMADEEFYDYD